MDSQDTFIASGAGAPATSENGRKAGIAQGLTIALASFLPVLAIVSLAPAVPSLMGHFKAVPNSQILVPMMVTAPGIMIALFGPMAGWATDKIGRRNLLLLATFIYGFFGLAPMFLSDLLPIFISRFGVGLSEAVLLTVLNTLIADYFDLKQRRLWLTVQGVIGPVLGTITITSAGFLTEKMWNGAFLIYSFAFVIFLAMLVFMFEPAKREGQALETAMSDEKFPWGKIWGICATTLLASILYYVFIINGGLAFAAVGAASSGQLGILISIASIGVPVGALIFGALSKTWKAMALIGTFMTFWAVGMIGMGFSRDAITMTAFAVSQQIGAGMAVVTLIYWVSQAMAPQHRGRGMGFWASAFFLGQFISPAIVGVLRGQIGGDILKTFAIMGGVAGIGAVVAFAQASKKNGAV
jgi:MFS family permease